MFSITKCEVVFYQFDGEINRQDICIEFLIFIYFNRLSVKSLPFVDNF